MIEKSLLPIRTPNAFIFQHTHDRRLQSAHPCRQPATFRIKSNECMQMIRHKHKAPQPSTTLRPTLAIFDNRP